MNNKNHYLHEYLQYCYIFLSCKRWERDLNEWQIFITANKIKLIY